MVKLNPVEKFFYKRILKKILKDNKANPILPAKPIDFRNPDELFRFAKQLEFLYNHGLNALFQLAEWRGATEMAALSPDSEPNKLYYQLGRVSAFYSLRSVVENLIGRAKKEAEKIQKNFERS